MANKEKQALAELRNRFRTKEDFNLGEKRLNNDKFLERYLRYNKWNVDKTEKMLEYYVELNEELGGETLFTRKFPKEILDLCRCTIGGRDYQNRPVAMVEDASSDLRGFLEKSDDAQVKLLFTAIFRMHLTMDRYVLERNVDYGVTIFDASRIKYSQYLHKKTMDFILNNSKTFEHHSPGVTGKFIIVNAPRIAKTVIQMIQKLVTFTCELIVYGKDETDWKEKLREHVPEDGVTPHFGGTLKPKQIERLFEGC